MTNSDFNLTRRQKRIKNILEFEGVQVPSWVKAREEFWYAILWQVNEIEKIINEKDKT